MHFTHLKKKLCTNLFTFKVLCFAILLIFTNTSPLSAYYEVRDKSSVCPRDVVTIHNFDWQINWRRVRNERDAEVCLAFVAINLHDLTKYEKWLNRQGFETIRIPQLVNGQILVSAFWSIDTNGVLFSENIFDYCVKRFFAHDFSVGNLFDLDQEIESVHVVVGYF